MSSEPQAPVDPAAWLIEWPEDDNFPVRWWNPAHGWMRDANKALHLARKTDADCYLSTMRFGQHLKVTEHKFVSHAAPVSHLSEATKSAWECMGRKQSEPGECNWVSRQQFEKEIAQLRGEADWKATAVAEDAKVTPAQLQVPYAAPVEEMLKDPNVVHLNMLHGGIAKPTWEQIKHLYPEHFPSSEECAPPVVQTIPLPLWAAEDLLKWMRRINAGKESLYPIGLENLLKALIDALSASAGAGVPEREGS